MRVTQSIRRVLLLVLTALSVTMLRAQDEPEQPSAKPPGEQRREQVQEQIRERREEMEQRKKAFEAMRNAQKKLREAEAEALKTSAAEEWTKFVLSLIDDVSQSDLHINVQTPSAGESGAVKISVIGPDGVIRDFHVGRATNPLWEAERKARFRIGAVVEALPDQLRSHFKLEPGEGVVVTRVFEGGPAANAGLKVHDIILAADDDALSGAEQLMEIVDKSEGAPIELTIIHEGDWTSLDVTPIGREKWDLPLLDDTLREAMQRELSKMSGEPPTASDPPHAPGSPEADHDFLESYYDTEIQKVGPGVVLERDGMRLCAGRIELGTPGAKATNGDAKAQAELKAQIEQLSRQIEALQQAVERLSHPKDASNDGGDE